MGRRADVRDPPRQEDRRCRLGEVLGAGVNAAVLMKSRVWSIMMTMTRPRTRSIDASRRTST